MCRIQRLTVPAMCLGRLECGAQARQLIDLEDFSGRTKRLMCRRSTTARERPAPSLSTPLAALGPSDCYCCYIAFGPTIHE